MHYNATITTLTPLHIGTGQELLNEYDLKQDGQRRQTYRLDVDAILEKSLTNQDDRLDRQLLSQKPADLVSLDELRLQPEFSVYVLDGQPRSGQVKEQIKNIWGHLYLPGSSLKGALRTALAFNIGAQRKGQLRPNNADKKSADDSIDRAIFGPNHPNIHNWINYDLLRALQVADSEPVEVKPRLINVSVIKKGTAQAPIDVEAIPQGVTFQTVIHLEEYLFKETAKTTRLSNGLPATPAERLGWEAERTKWLTHLPVAARNLARRRFREEQAYYQRVGLQRLARIYSIWQKGLASLKNSQTFYLQLGWAGGWDNKSYGRDLMAADQAGNYDSGRFAQIRRDFELGKPPGFKGQWQTKPEDIFPTSRRLRVDKDQNPIEPLGWVEVKLELIK